MKGLIAVLVATALLAVAGCAAGPEDRPHDLVQGTSMHEKEVRGEFWEKYYKERERKARERMDQPAETGLTD